eukprot:1139873-Pelagomonas_calceolata.AAC.1
MQAPTNPQQPAVRALGRHVPPFPDPLPPAQLPHHTPLLQASGAPVRCVPWPGRAIGQHCPGGAQGPAAHKCECGFELCWRHSGSSCAIVSA